MLLGVRFKAEDKRLAIRLETRNRHQQQLVNEAIASLLGEEPLYQEQTSTTDRLEATAFLINSGVILGYYGDKRELAAFVPTKPGAYKMITAKNPNGVLVDEEVASKVNESAFECYAGLPLRPLKFVDLLRFMFTRAFSPI